MYYNNTPCLRQIYNQGMPSMPNGYMQSMPMQQGMPNFPIESVGTGMPSGPSTAPMPLPKPLFPTIPAVPETVQSVQYVPGFLNTQIGKRVRIEFLIGTGALVDRTGTLLTVGASYVIIQLVDSDDLMLCDLYSIKFVTIF